MDKTATKIEKVILASQSESRQKILNILGISAELMPTNVDESISSKMLPKEVVMQLSHRKAEEADRLIKNPLALIIAADTIVAYEGHILGKPSDAEDAYTTLKMLSGSLHDVYSGITLVADGRFICDYCVTRVKFRDIDQKEIEEYIKLGDPFTKAGAYGVESAAATFIEYIEGDFFNIMGLPVCKFTEMLRSSFGITVFDL